MTNNPLQNLMIAVILEVGFKSSRIKTRQDYLFEVISSGIWSLMEFEDDPLAELIDNILDQTHFPERKH